MSPHLAPWMLLPGIAAIFHIWLVHGALSSATTWLLFTCPYDALLGQLRSLAKLHIVHEPLAYPRRDSYHLCFRVWFAIWEGGCRKLRDQHTFKTETGSGKANHRKILPASWWCSCITHGHFLAIPCETCLFMHSGFLTSCSALNFSQR